MLACLHGMLQPLPNVLFDNRFLTTCMAGCNSSHCSENTYVILDIHLKKILSNQMPYLTRRGDLSSSDFFFITKVFLVEKTCSTFSFGEKKNPPSNIK